MERDRIVRQIWETIEPELVEQGFELVEVEFKPGAGSAVLRLFIDCEGGVTLDNCQAVSQLVGPLLDKLDFIHTRYMLEVSSPGFDRPVRKAGDFERFAGETIKVVAHEPMEGRKRFSGTLKGLREGMVLIECDGTERAIHLENLQKANLVR